MYTAKLSAVSLLLQCFSVGGEVSGRVSEAMWSYIIALIHVRTDTELFGNIERMLPNLIVWQPHCIIHDLALLT